MGRPKKLKEEPTVTVAEVQTVEPTGFSPIKVLGDKQSKGEWFYRHNTLENDLSGEHWSKDESIIDLHEELFKNKTAVEYSWQFGNGKATDKLRLYAPKSVEGLDDVSPAESLGASPSNGFASSGGETATDKPKWSSNKQRQDDYWERKFEWDVVRTTRNDKKLEFQAYLNALSPLFVASLGEYNSTEDAVIALDAAAIAMYNRHNPQAQIVDVTKIPAENSETK